MKIQREIKFRAWDKKDGEMLEVHELYFVENSNKFGKGILDEHNDFHPLNEIDLMQFTGLLDKNGKEIYEGDIVSYNQSNTSDENMKLFKLKPDKAEISYCNENGCFFAMGWLGRGLKNMKNLKIIGNIYQNPKLLI